MKMGTMSTTRLSMRSFFLLIVFILSFQRSANSLATEGFLMTPDGVRLFYQHVEVEPQKEKGTVIFLHGWGMSYNEWADIKTKFEEDGWSTMVFDFRGHGASIEAHNRQLDYQEMDAPSARALIFVDIDTAMGYLFTKKPVWLIGSSIGANYALRYAAKNKYIHGVILLAPGYDNFEILPRDSNVMKEYGARPIMLIAARNNPWSFRTCMELKEQAMGSKIFYGVRSGHEMEGLKDKIPFVSLILNWMNEQTPTAKTIPSDFNPESISKPVHVTIEEI